MQQPPLEALLRNRPIVAGVVAVIAAGVLLYAFPPKSAFFSRFSRAAQGRPELHALVTAVGQRRTFEPRVTGDFAHGDFVPAPVTRGGEAATSEAPLDLRVAAIALEKRARESSDPVSLNAFGIAQLVTGQTAQAVSTLEEAVRLAPSDARLASDLAAGYLIQSRQSNRLEDVARAVGYARQATEANPRLAEARFNLALSLEGLSLRHEASKAWQSYLEVDSSSPWSREARQRLERLAETPEMRWEQQRREIIAAADRGDADSIRAVTERLPDAANEHVENDLIPGWADAWLARDDEKARKNGRLARLFGEALAASVGDRMALDAALAIERVSSNEGRADRLARGHQVFREGRSLYDQDRVAESTKPFEEARRALLEGESPFAAWAALQLAIAHYYRSEFDQSTRLLDALGRDAATQSHLRLLGRVQWMQGLIHYVKGQVADSLESSREALTRFERIGAAEDQAAMHRHIAENLEAVGDLTGAWVHKREALVKVAQIKLPRRRETIFASAARMAKRREFLSASIFLQNEVISDAQQAARPGSVVEGYLGRAEAHEAAGRIELAQQDIREAEQWLTRIGDKAVASRHTAEVMLAKGQTLQRANPTASIETFLSARRYFVEARMALRLPRVSLAIGRTYLAAGHKKSAEAAFLEGISELETQRASLPTGQLRLGYFDQPWDLFDEMIKLQAGDGATASALMFAERYRARDLFDTVSSNKQTGLINPATLATRLQPNTAIIYYACLDDRLLTWVVRASGVDFTQQMLPAGVLDQEITRYRTAIEKLEGEGISRAGFRLYDLLVRPLLPWIESAATLTIIPDSVLNRVSFAALRNRDTNRYLLEDHAVHVAPSATMFGLASARLDRTAPARRASLLVLANPQLDPLDAAKLPSLARAEDEARDLAALYADATVLTASRATKQAFLDTAAKYRIVHFAGHAVANEEYSLLSRLLLARDRSDQSGSVFAHEIQKLKLHMTDLVVLAGCRTGIGAIKKGEGVISLARPFLAAGVPSVIATLWDVNDDASRALFATFYKSIHQGTDPVVALRAAQLRLLRDSDVALRSPTAWGAFVSLGGLRSNGGSDAH